MGEALAKQQTTSPFTGVQIITASGELFNHVDKNGPLWAGDGDRQVRLKVRFVARFQRLPHIMLGICGMDSSCAQNLRFSLVAGHISVEGFEIVFKTWGDTKIARASINWSAIGQAVPSPATRR